MSSFKAGVLHLHLDFEVEGLFVIGVGSDLETLTHRCLAPAG